MSDKKNGKLIAVHCTHGLNRTGFMIISYLILRHKMSVADAIATFARSRSPGVYKPEYINDLYMRYEAKIPDGLEYPQLPEYAKKEAHKDTKGQKRGPPSGASMTRKSKKTRWSKNEKADSKVDSLFLLGLLYPFTVEH